MSPTSTYLPLLLDWAHQVHPSNMLVSCHSCQGLTILTLPAPPSSCLTKLVSTCPLVFLSAQPPIIIPSPSKSPFPKKSVQMLKLGIWKPDELSPPTFRSYFPSGTFVLATWAAFPVCQAFPLPLLPPYSGMTSSPLTFKILAPISELDSDAFCSIRYSSQLLKLLSFWPWSGPFLVFKLKYVFIFDIFCVIMHVLTSPWNGSFSSKAFFPVKSYEGFLIPLLPPSQPPSWHTHKLVLTAFLLQTSLR